MKTKAELIVALKPLMEKEGIQLGTMSKIIDNINKINDPGNTTTLSILDYETGNVILYAVDEMGQEETEDFIEDRGHDSGNCCFMTFDGTRVIDNR